MNDLNSNTIYGFEGRTYGLTFTVYGKLLLIKLVSSSEAMHVTIVTFIN